MSRRKVRGLTRTGRQVSEDPDLDNLLSNLSPEEMEELEQDMLKVPDIDQKDGIILAPGESLSTQPPAANNVQDTRLGTRRDSDPKGWRSQREQSFEGEPKRETRKQEYLRKMGLSQEGDDHKKGALHRQASVANEQENRLEERNNKGSDSSKDEQAGFSSRYRKWGSRDSDIKEGTKEKDKCEDSKLKDKQENRESTGNKTRDMISKLQEKKDDIREKERKEDCRKRDDSKTKDIISKLREKSEKEGGKGKDRKEGIRTSGLVSKMVEKQCKANESQGQESKSEERKANVEEKKDVDKDNKPDAKLERQRSEKGDGDVQVRDDKEEKRKANEEEVKHNNHVNGKDTKSGGEKRVEQKNQKADSKENLTNDEGSKPNKAGESKYVGNCIDGKNSNSKTKKEEEEDEDSSMFDELMEQVRSNDLSLNELNVNNSEVIKVKTLIQFAEALHSNTHVKTFALANCRADDHVAYAIAGTLRNNKTITSINLDSNHLTGKGILSLIQALQHNATLTELRFHNQRHICGGKTEMEMTKILKENTTLLKLGYHFELAGPRMTMTNILSRNMDRQRQKRLQEQKQAQANGEKGTLDVPKSSGIGFLRGSPRASPKPSPMASPMPSPKLKRVSGGLVPPPPPPPPGGGPPPPPGCGPPPPPPPPMDNKGPVSSKSSRDQLLDSIRGSDKHQLKKVPVPKWLQ